jgi:hypothetical protein
MLPPHPASQLNEIMSPRKEWQGSRKIRLVLNSVTHHVLRDFVNRLFCRALQSKRNVAIRTSGNTMGATVRRNGIHLNENA